MNLLFDSHVFLWLLFEPDRLGVATRREIEQAYGARVSAASIWELALKHRKGKLSHSPVDLVAGIAELGLIELPVLTRHLARLVEVELPHHDPFDALLAAQSIAERATLVTADRVLLAADLQTMDAGA